MFLNAERRTLLHVVLHNYNIVSIYVPTAVTRGKLAATHRQSRHGAASRVASELALNRALRAFITMVSSLISLGKRIVRGPQ